MRYKSIATIIVAFDISALFAGAGWADPAGQSPAGQAAPSPATPAGASPVQPKQPGNGLIDDMDSAWVWSGMNEYDDLSLHGASGHAGAAGTYGTYTFRGTAVDVIGMTAPSIVVGNVPRGMGKAQVIIDGKLVALASVSSTDVEYNASLCHVSGLSSGNHVIEIHAVDGWIVVDYIKVTDTAPAGGPAGHNRPPALVEGDYIIHPQDAIDEGLSSFASTSGSSVDIALASGRPIWHVTPLGNEHYRISPMSGPALALTINNTEQLHGETVGLVAVVTYDGDMGQQWVLSPSGPYFFQATIAAFVLTNSNVKPESAVVAYPNSSPEGAQHNKLWAFERIK